MRSWAGRGGTLALIRRAAVPVIFAGERLVDPARRATALLEGHIGLASITERIEATGGTLTISTAPLKGTTVRTALPAMSAAHVRA